MQIERTALSEVLLIRPDVYRDSRGWLFESYHFSKMAELGIQNVFVQDNHLKSCQRGILRGIHFQNTPAAQSKLVRCTVGRVADYAIDLRKGSPTYLRWICVELTAEGFEQLYIPAGFGHAVVSLTDESEVQYKVDLPYSPEHDRTVAWNDPELAIEWPFPENQLILSEKDANAPLLHNSDCNFSYH